MRAVESGCMRLRTSGVAGSLLVKAPLLILLLSVNMTPAEIYSSSARIELLLAAQDVLIRQVEDYIQRQQVRLDDLKSGLDRLRNGSATDSYPRGSSSLSGHPINAHNLLTDWADIQITGKQSSYAWTGLQHHIEATVGISLPTDKDVDGSVDGLLRLQETYALSSEDMSEGVVAGVSALRQLSSHDMFMLGKASLSKGNVERAVEWLEMTYRDPSWTADERVHILSELARAYHMMGRYTEELQLLDECNKNGSGRVYQDLEKRLELMRQLNASGALHKQGQGYVQMKEDDVLKYQGLCRGDHDMQTKISHSRPAICRLVYSSVPYDIFKEEVLSWDPFIVQFHDVISKKEARLMQLTALPMLRRAEVGFEDSSALKPVTISGRIGNVAWIHDKENEVFMRLTKRIHALTGLQTEPVRGIASAEPFQVVNYGIGGQYEPHCDFVKGTHPTAMGVPELGNRLATFMFYLGDVKSGGATVFPELNIRIEPLKYSAAFWYNMRGDGEVDFRTCHAGCPVLMGHKWVANKWIRERGQNTCIRHI